MKRLNLPLVADTLFFAVCFFLLFFTAVRFYTKNAVLGLVFGIAAAVLFGALGYLYISRKQNKRLLISRDERQKKLLALHLSLSSDDYVLKLIKSISGEGAIRRGKRIVADGCNIFCEFMMQPLSEDNIARVIKSRAEGKKILYCNTLSPEAASLSENFAIEVRGIDWVYTQLKECGLLPEKYIFEGAQKIGVFKKIRSRFSRKITAPLFWSGFSLLALSYFTFFPVYYVISGGVLLVLAAVSLAFN